MFLKQLGIAGLLATAVLANSAHAGDIYLGGQFGKSKFSDWISEDDYAEILLYAGVGTFNSYKTEETDTAFKGYVGFNINPNLDIRVGYADLGEASAKANRPGAAMDMTHEVSAVFLDALIKGEVAPGLNVFAKIGGAYATAELNMHAQGPGGTATGNIGETKTLVFVPGFGASYDFTPNFGVVIEAERYVDVGDDEETPATDIDVLSAGAYFHF